MDFKLIILLGVLLSVFLMANASTQKQKYKNSRRTKSIKTTSNSNRGIIRVEDPESFTTAVPVTTYRPRSSGNYIRTSTPSSTIAENYQSSVNYEPQKYQPQNYPFIMNLPIYYNSRNYHSSEVRPVFEPYFEKDPSGVNYVTETNFVQPERVNSMKNVESTLYSSDPQSEVVNSGYGPVFSKSGYAIVPNVSPNSVNVMLKDYVAPIYGGNSLSPRGFSNFNAVTQKPLKIAYSPANEVAHVSYSGGNGQVYYSW